MIGRRPNLSDSWRRFCSLITIVLTAFIAALFSSMAEAQLAEQISVPRPEQREFISDTADLISEADEQKIRATADQLLTDRAAPIIVVTIDSMASHGGAGLQIETFARLLFDQWQIGPAKRGDTSWNYGILLLVSRGDRQARIELGAGWDHEKDRTAQQIMDGLIIPRFRQGDFSGGILAGVEGLDRMARDLGLPSRPMPTSSRWILMVFLGLAVFTAISLYRRGSSGWAWLFWGGVFAAVAAIAYAFGRSSDSSGDSWGGFSGGSFGDGGFSGGGGASGSW